MSRPRVLPLFLFPLFAQVSFDRYKALFSDMDEFVKEIPDDFTLEWFLNRRKELLEQQQAGG